MSCLIKNIFVVLNQVMNIIKNEGFINFSLHFTENYKYDLCETTHS